MLAMLPVSAAARGHRGGFYRPVIVPHVWFGYGGGFGPYWGYPYYQPYMYSRPNTGKVKLETDAKDAKVYINGSYAGTVGELKAIQLKGGSYTIELRDPNGQSYQEKIYVVPGKTLHLHPDPDLRDGS